MSDKFTAGPWHVESSMIDLLIRDANGKRIATMLEWPTAYLIASAPDLYAACESALELIGIERGYEEEEEAFTPMGRAFNELSAKLQAAIQKARGE